MGSQNSHRKLSTSTIGPATTMPVPSPTAPSEATTLRPPLTCSRGNSSRMMPNESGTTPPPTPWMMRATISHPMLGANAATKDPVAKAPREATRTSLFPRASPSRPSSGVQIEAESKYAVSTHVAVAWLVWNARCSSPSTGITSDCRSANDATEVVRTANVRWWLGLITCTSSPTPVVTRCRLQLFRILYHRGTSRMVSGSARTAAAATRTTSWGRPRGSCWRRPSSACSWNSPLIGAKDALRHAN